MLLICWASCDVPLGNVAAFVVGARNGRMVSSTKSAICAQSSSEFIRIDFVQYSV